MALGQGTQLGQGAGGAYAKRSLQSQISQGPSTNQAGRKGGDGQQDFQSDGFSGEDEEEDEYGCGSGEDSDDNCDDELDDSDEDEEPEEDDDEDDDDDDDEEDLEGVLFDNMNMQAAGCETQQFSNNFFIELNKNPRKIPNKFRSQLIDKASILMQGFLKDASQAQRAEIQSALE